MAPRYGNLEKIANWSTIGRILSSCLSIEYYTFYYCYFDCLHMDSYLYIVNIKTYVDLPKGSPELMLELQAIIGEFVTLSKIAIS